MRRTALTTAVAGILLGPALAWAGDARCTEAAKADRDASTSQSCCASSVIHAADSKDKCQTCASSKKQAARSGHKQTSHRPAGDGKPAPRAQAAALCGDPGATPPRQMAGVTAFGGNKSTFAALAETIHNG